MYQAIRNAPFIGSIFRRSKLVCEQLISQSYSSGQNLKRVSGLDQGYRFGMDPKTEMSVLACDIVGSTDMAQSVSPEKLQQIVYAYHDYCAGLVNAQSGKVARYMGDDCLAFFETGEVSDKPTHRAVYAAESILRNKRYLEVAAGHPLDLRLGIATGIVIQDESRTEQSIVGEPLHLANRLQLVGEENCITVCAKTWSQTRDEIDYTASGYLKLKGYTALVQAWTCRRRAG